jgi:hypothetical protein
MSQMTTNYLNPITDFFEQVHGMHGRMFVDVGNLNPVDNDHFFMFHEYSVPAHGTEVVKVVITGDTIMQSFSIKVMSGTARVEIVTGGTEGGTYSQSVPVLPVNNMSTAASKTSTTTVTSGGTHTGGTTLDLFLVNTGDNAHQSVGVSVGEAFSFGFAAGTYYIRVTNTDNSTSTGLIKALWIEL